MIHRLRVPVAAALALAFCGAAACATGGDGNPRDAFPDGREAESHGPDDGGPPDAPDGGDGEAEAGPCAPGDPEICDGVDNDCDGATDEDFDLSSDMENCGECGASCSTLPNADAVCSDGACAIGACHAGFVDANRGPGDGCEYECTPSASAESADDGTCEDGLDNECDGRTDGDDPDCSDCVPEFCDGADNDCDGATDEDFDVDFDPLNCGRCGLVCPMRPNAVPICVLGGCDIECRAGWADLNGRSADGCEAACAPGGDPGEGECNGADDDCDGRTDEGYVPYTCGLGPCLRDSVCSRGSTTCEPRTPPSPTDTTCDGLDDDCDGTADDDVDCRCATDTDCDDANPCTRDTCFDHLCSVAPIDDGTACPAGICCGGACVDASTDPSHCGSCTGVCGPGSACSSASCACTGGLLNCDGDWVNGCEADPAADPANCGSCGSRCGAHATCLTGACACAPGWLDCNGSWSDGCEANPSADPANCGSCGNACGPRSSCASGSCACAAPFLNCDGSWANGCEADPNSDAANCGRCGNSCGANSVCSAGTCACAGSYVNCNGSWSDGCEVDPWTDPDNCGSCGNRCGSNARCSGGGCACNPGWGNCRGGWSDGCETPLTTLSDCGSCGSRCDLANATESCAGGACTLGTCNPGWGNCNGSTSDGCETSTTTLSNCGSCGNPCNPANATGPSCGSGTCTFSGCMSGWGNCNGSIPDGCETSTTTLSNCGSCGAGCDLANASESCPGGTCTLGSCFAGYGNCNGSSADGCETNLGSPTTCGSSCGAITNCTTLPYVSSASCSSGSCSISSCNSGRAECDDVVSNGCERLLDDNYGSCGINNMGTISGDTGAGTLGFSSYGENWVYFRLTEDSWSSVYLSATITLDVPAGVDYDIFVHCGGSCSSGGPNGRAGTGVDESVNIRWEDTPVLDDGRNVYVEIRFWSGSTTACGGWTLTVYGDTLVGSSTC